MAFTPRSFYLFNEITLAIRDGLQRVVGEFDLSVAQFTVLSQLKWQGPISATKLARARNVSPQTMNELLTGLETRGFVTRERDAADRRELLVSLAEEGRRRLAECDMAVDRLETEFFSGLSQKKHKILRDLLGELVIDHRSPDALPPLFKPNQKD